MTKIQESGDRVVANVERVIVGKHHEVQLALVALLCRGHLLIEDVPGTGKTVLAKAIARSLGCTFRRIQFTPDLLPSDVTGLSIFNQKTVEFEFRPGPIMSQVVLADEINRATPKTQSALLECMEERQATIDGVSHLMPDPFLVIATQNPIEYEGTFPLPEAQIDRFLLRMPIGYPSALAESEMLLRLQLEHPIEQVTQVVTTDDLLAAQRQVRQVFVHEKVRDYVVRLAQATRTHQEIALGASPRGSLSLLRCAQATAAASGMSFVLPDHVKAVLIPALGHRLILTPEARLSGRLPEMVLHSILTSVEPPVGEAYTG